jgi:hypothetical protein
VTEDKQFSKEGGGTKVDPPPVGEVQASPPGVWFCLPLKVNPKILKSSDFGIVTWVHPQI